MEEGVENKMILVINVCRERLHYYEFIKPIEDILRAGGFEFESWHYKQLNDRVLSKADKIIICGTSLKDNKFVEDIDCFEFLKNFEKPVLGICAGMQILGLVFGGKSREYLEIGFFREMFVREFLGLNGNVEVYHLHNNYIEFADDFEIFSKGRLAQAVKFKDKEFYGVLFHPEVRNKEMILRFCEI